MADEILRILKARLRREHQGDLAHAIDNLDRWQLLPERRKATLDAFVFGIGYLVEGKRVDPVKVEMVRVDT